MFQHPGSLPNKLQTIQLTQITTQECASRFSGRQIYQTNVCTVSPYGQGACHVCIYMHSDFVQIENLLIYDEILLTG